MSKNRENSPLQELLENKLWQKEWQTGATEAACSFMGLCAKIFLLMQEEEKLSMQMSPQTIPDWREGGCTFRNGTLFASELYSTNTNYFLICGT